MLSGRVVRPRGAPVSLFVMYLPFKLSAMIAVVFTMCVCAGARLEAQASGTQQPGTQQPDSQQPSSQPQQGSSSSTQQPAGQGQAEQSSEYGVYLAVDPLAN